jgi:L-gulonolactone oxidase
VRFEEMEYAVPREHAADGLRTAKAILERHAVSFPIELRFVAGDDTFLSPAYGGARAYIAVHVFRGMAFERPFREVEEAVGAFGGRPAWGKRSYLSAAELAPRYPRWDDFQAIRRELDPGGRFANAWSRHVLG